MDPDSVKSTLSNLAFGNVMAAAARDYQKEVLAQEKAQASASINQEVDLDELMDDPELEKLHADRIAALKKEAEKREKLKNQGCGEYREITEGDFLGEVTGCEKVICHFYHQEFYRCKFTLVKRNIKLLVFDSSIVFSSSSDSQESLHPNEFVGKFCGTRIMDKHLKFLSVRHIDTKFIKLDAENAPFFVAKLAIKTLPCVILFRNGIATDRLVGFQDLGGKDDFATKTLEVLLIRKGIISEIKGDEDEDDDYHENKRRTVRSSVEINSDSD